MASLLKLIMQHMVSFMDLSRFIWFYALMELRDIIARMRSSKLVDTLLTNKHEKRVDSKIIQ